jgi:hypothetical protein
MNDTLALIFSYKRPMQLDSCLKSLTNLCTDYKDMDITVLYRTDDIRFENAYAQVSKENIDVAFIKETNFRKNVLDLISNYKYIMFLTDDNIFINSFQLIDAKRILLRHEGVLGFSLRLGLNTKYCYPVSKEQLIPPYVIVNGNIIMWNWEFASYDFGYPLELSSSIYRMHDINVILVNCNFNNPNEMEYVMDFCKGFTHTIHPSMGCYKKSVAFCAPVNKVKENNQNKSGLNKENSINSLLTKFENGDRIDVNKLIGFTPNACHQEIDFDFYHT